MHATMIRLPIRLHPHGRPAEPLELNLHTTVIAGWAGRDKAAVQAHIDELAALGVPPPPATPVFYRVATSRLTTAPRIEVTGEDSSGEVECVFASTPSGLLVGLGSDHTDRALETRGIALSKQVCDKPVGADWWRFEDVSAHWDALELRAWLTPGQDLYQEGAVSALLDPRDLMRDCALPEGGLMFGGTMPVHGGIRGAPGFAMELRDPVLGRSLRHAYEVVSLPVA